jgi:hypothetical protein
MGGFVIEKRRKVRFGEEKECDSEGKSGDDQGDPIGPYPVEVIF